MGKRLVWFEIYVDDIERAERFYGDVFGWRFCDLEGMPTHLYRMIENTPEGSVGGAIVGGVPDRVGAGGTVPYIEVDDLASAIETVASRGGRLHHAPQLINETDGSFALINDSEGNIIGLWSRL